MSDVPDSYFVNGAELLEFRREPILGIVGPGEVKRVKKKRKAAPHKQKLFERDGDECHYCNLKLVMAVGNGPFNASVEHIVPRVLGGTNLLSNLVLAHRKCNNELGDRYIKCLCNFCKKARAIHEGIVPDPSRV